MSKDLSSILYDVSRKVAKAAGTVKDIEAVVSGDPSKIVKRVINKKINKEVYGKTNGLVRSLKKKAGL